MAGAKDSPRDAVIWLHVISGIPKSHDSASNNPERAEMARLTRAKMYPVYWLT